MKLFDFGLARELPSARSKATDVFSMSGKIGTTRYMAPEVALSKAYNRKVDTYSWAVLYWQCLTLEKPYEEFNKPTHLLKVCKLGHRLPLAKLPENIGALLQKSWDHNIRKRYTIAEVCAKMDRIEENLSGSPEKDSPSVDSLKSRGSAFRLPKFMRGRKRSITITSSAS